MNGTARGGRAVDVRVSAQPGVDLVVVTGPHRSGTTFLGHVLATATRARLLGYEPLNPEWGLRSVDGWYWPAHRVSDDLVRLRRGLPVRWTPAQSPPGASLKATVRSCQNNALFASARVLGRPVVVKDPFLSLSLDFVADQLTERPIVVATRHPAAWCMSIRRMQWHAGTLLDDLQDRPVLQDVVRSTRLPRRRWTDAPLLESAAWAWKVLTAAVREQTGALPGRVVVTPLEGLQVDPVRSCLDLIRTVGLSPSARSEPVIRELTSGIEVVPETTEQHVLQRDTRRSLEAWRRRLDPADQDLIWEICEEVAEPWYGR